MRHSECIRFRDERRPQLPREPVQFVDYLLHMWLPRRPDTVAIPADTNPAIAVSPNRGATLDHFDLLLLCSAQCTYRIRLAIHPWFLGIWLRGWRHYTHGLVVYTPRAQQAYRNFLLGELRCQHVQWLSPSSDLPRYEWNRWSSWLAMALYLLRYHQSSRSALGLLCHTRQSVYLKSKVDVARGS